MIKNYPESSWDIQCDLLQGCKWKLKTYNKLSHEERIAIAYDDHIHNLSICDMIKKYQNIEIKALKLVVQGFRETGRTKLYLDRRSMYNNYNKR